MSFDQTFVIVNNSPYTLVLDTSGSENLGNGEWPSSIAPFTTPASFPQSGTFSVNPTAVYMCQGANPPVNIYMHFYCALADPALHVNMTMDFSGAAVFPGSCISETNSIPAVPQVCAPQELFIRTTQLSGSSRGTATFTVGNPS